MSGEAQFKKRVRGVILSLVRARREKRKPPYDDWSLAGLLQKLGFDVYREGVQSLVEDLAKRGYLTCQTHRDESSGVLSITRIELTPDGDDILDGHEKDAAVFVEPE